MGLKRLDFLPFLPTERKLEASTGLPFLRMDLLLNQQEAMVEMAFYQSAHLKMVLENRLSGRDIQLNSFLLTHLLS